APDAKSVQIEIEAAGEATSTRVKFLYATDDAGITQAFTAIQQSRAKALLVVANQLFVTHRERIVGLVAQQAIPASYPFREFAIAGGLVSYGANLGDGYRKAGAYAARILKGAKPAELPVVQADNVELVLNL